jgi:hypothetical protein
VHLLPRHPEPPLTAAELHYRRTASRGSGQTRRGPGPYRRQRLKAPSRLRARLMMLEGYTHLSRCSSSRRIHGGRNGGRKAATQLLANKSTN